MSDYELAALFVDHRDAWISSVEQMYTILGVFLVASALSATRLSRGLMIIVLATYAVLYQSAAFTASGDAENFFAIVGHIKTEVSAASSQLDWHVALNLPDAMLGIAPTLGTATNMLVFLFSLYFFYLCRRGQFSLHTEGLAEQKT